MTSNDHFGAFDDVSSALLGPIDVDFQFLNSIPVLEPMGIEQNMCLETAAVQVYNGDFNWNSLNTVNTHVTQNTFNQPVNTIVPSDTQTVSPQALSYQASLPFESTQTYPFETVNQPFECQTYQTIENQSNLLKYQQPTHQPFVTPALLLEQPVDLAVQAFDYSYVGTNEAIQPQTSIPSQSIVQNTSQAIPSVPAPQLNQQESYTVQAEARYDTTQFPETKIEEVKQESQEVPSANPIISPSHFQDWKQKTDFYVPLKFCPDNPEEMEKFRSDIQHDFDQIQCESELVRNLLYSMFPNPYTSMFNVAAQEQSPDKEKPQQYRYTWGRKDDVYSSMWYRIDTYGTDREGGERYCALCKSWHKTRNHSWANHQSSVHGISAVTKSIYPFPTGVILDEKSVEPDRSKKPRAEKELKLKGWCRKCSSFVHLFNKQSGGRYTTWFRHQDAHFRQEMQEKRGGKIHTPNNPRNSKKRSASGSSTPSGSATPGSGSGRSTPRSQYPRRTPSPTKPRSPSPLSNTVVLANEVISHQFKLKKRCLEGDVERDKGKEKEEEDEEEEEEVEPEKEQVQEPAPVQGQPSPSSSSNDYFSEETIGGLIEEIEGELDETPSPVEATTVVETTTVAEPVKNWDASETKDTQGLSPTTVVENQSPADETPAIDFTQNPFICDFDEPDVSFFGLNF